VRAIAAARRSRPRWGALPLAVALVLALELAVAPHAAPAAASATGSVSVFPSPGTKYNPPQTQITFRGVAPAGIGTVTVTGSQSGPHAGTIKPDSDGDGASFIPSVPFTPGETVTVTSSLDVLGGHNGEFSFAIAHSVGPIVYGGLPKVSAVPHGIQTFVTRPDLQPASVDVTVDKAPASQGDIFVAPQFGPKQDGPMILDPEGHLIWFLPSPVQENQLITDFRVQELHGQPVLTWWQGNTNQGHGRGVGEIYNQSYQPIGTVAAGNGLDMDLHEFLLTNQGDAYFTAAFRVRVPGISRPVVDAVVQEVDIATGLVLFQWDALDHVPLSESYFKPNQTGLNYDPYHLNSISLDPDGSLVFSMRNTSSVYDVDHQSGNVIWTLGGKDSSFKMGPGTSTWGQHMAVMHTGNQLTIFDDGGAPPRVHPDSRGIRVVLNTRTKTAKLIKEYDHSPQLPSAFEGSLQPLSHGDVFLGWGQQPYFSEDDASGRQIFDAHFAEPSGSYRAYRYPWTGSPPLSELRTAARAASGGAVDLYASWNGATGVSSWRALGGASATALKPLATAPKRNFETELSVRGGSAYYAVQALASSGAVLGTSAAIAAPAKRG
jgi:Arylsulfotransferase (ASST)